MNKKFEEFINETKKIELTEQAYKDILRRLDKLEELQKCQNEDVIELKRHKGLLWNEYAKLGREVVYLKGKSGELNGKIKKIEEFNKILMDDFWNDHYKAIHNADETKTADQMFEELGYKIDDWQEDGSIQYCKEGNIKKNDYEMILINIYKENKEWVYYKQKDYDMGGITRAEQRAINKKIKELSE